MGGADALQKTMSVWKQKNGWFCAAPPSCAGSNAAFSRLSNALVAAFDFF